MTPVEWGYPVQSSPLENALNVENNMFLSLSSIGEMTNNSYQR